MNILHFNYSLTFGGIETMLVNIANEQVKMGHHVSIIIMWNKVESSLQKALDSRVKLYLINKPQSSFNPFYYIKLNWILMMIPFDVLHVHSAKLIDYIWLPKVRNKSCLTQHRNCNGIGCDRIPKFNRVYSISKCVQEDIFKTFGKQSYVVYNGIKPYDFDKNAIKYSSIDNIFHIVQVGRLVHEDKGQHVLIKAIAELLKKYDGQFHVDFIGDGPSRSYLQKMCAELFVSDYISFLGNKSQDYIRENLCKYDLFVQPSLFEGFGLTVAEAMAAKVPVLVADNLGPMEVINYGEYGSFFKIGDSVDCADKLLKQIINSPSIEMIEKAKMHVMNTFDVAHTAREYTDTYLRKY